MDLPTDTFLSTFAQEGIAFFVLAAGVIGLVWYLKVMDTRAEKRNTAEEVRLAKQAEYEEERQKAADERYAALITQIVQQQKLADERYAALISQIMEQQKNMMNLLFGVVNRNSNVQEKIVESLNAPASTTANTPPDKG